MRFTRVTVVGDGRQLDISLPADGPLGEHLPAVLRLLSVPPTDLPARWRLASPATGTIDPARSLDEVGVLDGVRLHLTEAATAPPPPVLTDVEAAVAGMVADRAPTWSGPARRSGVGLLVAMVLVGSILASGWAAGVPSWLLPLAAGGGGLAVAALVSGWAGWACALTAVPAATVALTAAVTGGSRQGGRGPAAVLTWPAGAQDGWPHGFPLAAAAVAAVALAFAGAVRRSPGTVLAAVAVAILATGGFVGSRFGMPADRIAALTLVASLVLTAVAGRVGLAGAGLVALLAAGERGEPVARRAVDGAVNRGVALTTGLVGAAAVAGTFSCCVLVTEQSTQGFRGTWVAPVLGVVGAALFALRSRTFSRAIQVGSMLCVPVVVTVAVAVRLPVWLSSGPQAGQVLPTLLLLGAAAALAWTGLGTVSEVAAARTQRLLDHIELVAALAVIPGLVLLFRVIPMVQRWWS